MDQAVAIVVIGNEILSGTVRDENSYFLVCELHALGVAVRTIRVVPDEVGAIGETLRECAVRHAWVLTSGGVGPTLDDVTFEAVARAFGVPLVVHPELERIIREHVGARTNANHLRMAHVPAGTELVHSAGVSWPTTRFRNVLLLPGSPALLRTKWAAVRPLFRGTPFVTRGVDTTLEEGLLAPHLDALHAAHPAVRVGSYPVMEPADHAVRVVLEAHDAGRVDAALRDLLDRLGPGHVVRVHPLHD